MTAEPREGNAASRIPGRLPPFRRRAFWVVQGLVLLIAVWHTALETVLQVQFPVALYLVPSSLFFIPVVYAALEFGVRGAVPTALWAVLLTVPNLMFLHHGVDRLGVLWQGAILLTIGVFVGSAVDRERRARDEAEAREAARLASEARYRALFDRSGEAVLVVGDDGRVEEANAAAGQLLGRPASSLHGLTLDEAVGPSLAEAVRAPRRDLRPLAVDGPDGRTFWVQPVLTEPPDSGAAAGGRQVMLRDVTLQYERQQGLEGWARLAMAAREEERRRLAREIHDGPVQSLVLLARKLDALDEAGDRDAEVEEARAIADDTAGELRRISRAMRPPILDDLGLVAAVRSEVAALARRSGLEATFEAAGDLRPLAPDVELLLLRLAQEGLHNVERHARASAVRVVLSYATDSVTLEVADDGVGMGPVPAASALLAKGKLGLVGMQERVRLAQGSIEIAGRPGGGTAVRVEVPATPSAPAAGGAVLPGPHAWLRGEEAAAAGAGLGRHGEGRWPARAPSAASTGSGGGSTSTQSPDIRAPASADLSR